MGPNVIPAAGERSFVPNGAVHLTIILQVRRDSRHLGSLLGQLPRKRYVDRGFVRRFDDRLIRDYVTVILHVVPRVEQAVVEPQYDTFMCIDLQTR